MWTLLCRHSSDAIDVLQLCRCACTLPFPRAAILNCSTRLCLDDKRSRFSASTINPHQPAFSCYPGGQKRDEGQSLGWIGTPVTRARGRPRAATHCSRTGQKPRAHRSAFIIHWGARAGQTKQGASEEEAVRRVSAVRWAAPAADARVSYIYLLFIQTAHVQDEFVAQFPYLRKRRSNTRCRALFRGNGEHPEHRPLHASFLRWRAKLDLWKSLLASVVLS